MNLCYAASKDYKPMSSPTLLGGVIRARDSISCSRHIYSLSTLLAGEVEEAGRFIGVMSC